MKDVTGFFNEHYIFENLISYPFRRLGKYIALIEAKSSFDRISAS
jgi:hypothetical protein